MNIALLLFKQRAPQAIRLGAMILTIVSKYFPKLPRFINPDMKVTPKIL